jgi:porin
MNGTFGAFTFVGANLPDPYDPNVYPMASPGVRFLVQPVSFFYFQTGLYNGTTESQVANPNGIHFPVDSSSGALIFSEVGFLLNQSPNDRGLQGTYKVGSFTHTHNFNSWSSQQNNVLLGTNLDSGGTDYGLYGVMDQQLFYDGEKTISAFCRVASAPSNVNVISWYVDGGFNFQGFIPTRRYDTAGLAVSRSIFSNQYSDFQVNANGTNAYGAETVLEATYKYQLSPWWTIQPDLQYIFTPSGQDGSKDAMVVGLRTTVAF